MTLNKGMIVRTRLSEQIADGLENVILNRELEDNERFPSEQTLAEQFNVSKNVIRESLSILRERGLVEIQNGVGNFVSRPEAENLSDVMGRMIVLDNIDYRQIYDTRIILETAACRRAAEKITPMELAKLERLQKKLKNRVLPISERRELDLDFHMGIAEASGNNLLVVLTRAMRNIFSNSMFLKEDIERWDSVDESIRYHCQILDALIAHDAKGAEKTMQEHLTVALKNIERSMQ